MKLDFINREGNSRLILIFTGWSTDSQFYKGFSHPGWDIVVVSGYSDNEFPMGILDGYATIALFAWSLGVFMAEMTLPYENISIAVAINGTPFPVDDNMGIPISIYENTEINLDARNLLKFRKRMSGKKFDEIAKRFLPEDIDALKKELRFVRERYFESDKEKRRHIRWQKCYIGSDDRIFPFENQKRAWSKLSSIPEIIELEAPHYIDIEKIIKAALPDTENIGRSFKKAVPTYSDEAVPQKMIAQKLIELCPHTKCGNLLEIGPGTGIFSKLITEKLRPDIIDFIELYPIPPFDIAREENYLIGDAEYIVYEKSKADTPAYDAVVSSSTIQWFVNPKAFFKNISRLIKKEGFLLCSSFLPYNLMEMRDANPYNLVYRSIEELYDLLTPWFEVVDISSENFHLKFDDKLSLLRHLHHTGVSGGLSSGKTISKLIKLLPEELIYRPVFILAKNPKNLEIL